MSGHQVPSGYPPDDPLGMKSTRVCEEKMREMVYYVSLRFKGAAMDIEDPQAIISLRNDPDVFSRCPCSLRGPKACHHQFLTIDRCLSEPDWAVFQDAVNQFGRLRNESFAAWEWKHLSMDLMVIMDKFIKNYSRMYNSFMAPN